MIGTTTAGTTISTMAVSLGLVIASMTMAPTNVRKLRSASDKLEPMTVCNSYVSVVSLDRTSPVLVVSK